MTRKGWSTEIAALVCAVALLLATPALAERRVALVIGNAAYLEAPPLANPTNDAADMRAKLTELGFEIHGGSDLDRARLVGALRDFGRAVETADVALVFYAGHGLQVGGQNYLVPIDAKVEYEAELTLVLVPFDDVLRQLNRSPNVKIVLLDACRDNPFAKTLSRTLGSRSTDVLGRGLTVVQRVSGTYIAYATQPDAVAQDGQGRNSPFTAALLRHMAEPGRSLPDMMVEVRKSVMAATGGRQVPWDTSSLTGHFSFRAKDTAPNRSDQNAPTAVAPPSAGSLGGRYAVEAHGRSEEAIATSPAPAPFAPPTPPPSVTSDAAVPSDGPPISSPLGRAVNAGLQNFLAQTLEDLAAARNPKPIIDPVTRAKIAETNLATLAKSTPLMPDALRLGEAAFGKHCASCHGVGTSDPVAGPLMPRDRSWVWGGSLEEIDRTIRWGIRADNTKTRDMVMPAFGVDGILPPAEIGEVAGFVKSLSDRSVKATAKGKRIWSDNCSSCHGDTGKGNTEMGAPDLTRGTPMYGRDIAAIADQIRAPRLGSCQGWEGKLDEATLKSLVVLVHARSK